jgi:hypothetical protein
MSLPRLLLSLMLLALPALGGDLASLTKTEAGKGLKEALTQGVGQAVGKLSAADGFLGDPEVKIPLPPTLRKAEELLRQLGQGERADELVTAMNRAAESAVAEARPILVDGIKKMTLDDAKAILKGPDDSATQYFRKASGETIVARFLPKVQAAMGRVKLAEDYNRFAGPAAQFGLIDAQDANLDQFITRKAVDGLFLMIAKQEKAIRADPVGQGSKLLQKVFSAALKP